MSAARPSQHVVYVVFVQTNPFKEIVTAFRLQEQAHWVQRYMIVVISQFLNIVVVVVVVMSSGLLCFGVFAPCTGRLRTEKWMNADDAEISNERLMRRVRKIQDVIGLPAVETLRDDKCKVISRR